MSANWEKRSLHSFGSNFRLDICNPQTTTSGNQIYELYAVTDEEEDVNLIGFGENGNYHIYNDRTIEIVGGQKTSFWQESVGGDEPKKIQAFLCFLMELFW